jgi:hypothetical protein
MQPLNVVGMQFKSDMGSKGEGADRGGRLNCRSDSGMYFGAGG